MNRAQTIAAIKALSPDLTARFISDTGEYRVSLSIYAISRLYPTWKEPRCAAKNEAMACYTNDAEDALGTARIIAAKHAERVAERARQDAAPTPNAAYFYNGCEL